MLASIQVFVAYHVERVQTVFFKYTPNVLRRQEIKPMAGIGGAMLWKLSKGQGGFPEEAERVLGREFKPDGEDLGRDFQVRGNGVHKDKGRNTQLREQAAGQRPR